jgi:uncharacterized OB-fold protein
VSTSRPLPVVDGLSAPFWRAADQGRLVIARCSRCDRFVHPPDVACGHCGHTDPEFRFEEVDGRGTVRSWTVVRRSFLPGFEDVVPFVLVDVELDDTGSDDRRDVRLIGRLVDGPEAPLVLGARVVTVFERLADGVAVPAFELVEP